MTMTGWHLHAPDRRQALQQPGPEAEQLAHQVDEGVVQGGLLRLHHRVLQYALHTLATARWGLCIEFIH